MKACNVSPAEFLSVLSYVRLPFPVEWYCETGIISLAVHFYSSKSRRKSDRIRNVCYSAVDSQGKGIRHFKVKAKIEG